MDIIAENAIPAFLESTQLTVELESVDLYNNIIFPVQAKVQPIHPQVEVPYDLSNGHDTWEPIEEGIFPSE